MSLLKEDKCSKCSAKALKKGADGRPYCAYCVQYAPKVIK